MNETDTPPLHANEVQSAPPSVELSEGELMLARATNEEEAAEAVQTVHREQQREKLREALRAAPTALGKLTAYSPRLLAKDTVERGLNAAVAAGENAVRRNPERT